MPHPKLAVVTGASTGIGHATTCLLATRGFHVLAGVRKQADVDRLKSANIEPVIVDITEPEQVASLRARVESDPQHRPLKVLVNNAGLSVSAPAEMIPLDDWRSNFEVNFFGHVAVTNALLPALAAADHSRLVNISSIAGLFAGPSFGPYGAAKWAIEGYSDIIRRELGHTGVKVIVIQPGSVKTPGWSKGVSTMSASIDRMDEQQHTRYDALMKGLGKQAELRGGAGVEAAVAAEVIVNAIEARRPRTRYRIGNDAKVMAAVAKLLGDKTVDRLVSHMVTAH